MEDGYIGEIRMFAGNFAPSNWYFCNGQTINISDNTALYSIIGTIYGGDGRNTMALPDFRGVFPMGFGTNSSGGGTYKIGKTGGSAENELTVNNLPSHSHELVASKDSGTQSNPKNAILANTGSFDSEYLKNAPSSSLVNMSDSAIANTGNNSPVNNMPPYQAISFIICYSGTYPSRS
ncbi:MAG: tail fiber protein [Bacteroidota bacterium]